MTTGRKIDRQTNGPQASVAVVACAEGALPGIQRREAAQP